MGDEQKMEPGKERDGEGVKEGFGECGGIGYKGDEQKVEPGKEGYGDEE